MAKEHHQKHCAKEESGSRSLEEVQGVNGQEPFLISTLVNRNCFATTLVDTRCLSYRLIDSSFVPEHKLKRINIFPCGITRFDAPSDSQITEVAVVSMDIDGHPKEQVFLYVVLRLALYIMILRMLWVKKQDV